MITVAGLLLGIALARLAGPRERWLRDALLGQVADLVTFMTIWEFGYGEQNPLAHLVLDVSRQVFGTSSVIADYVSTIVLVALKLCLLGYLALAQQHLGRYRRPVLAIAAVAGAVGATSNVLAYGNAGISLLVVAAFAYVAARRPERFREALGVGARLVVTGALGVGGLAADSYLRWVAYGYACAAMDCSPLLIPLLLAGAVAMYGGAMLALWATLLSVAKFVSWRVSPWRASHAH